MPSLPLSSSCVSKQPCNKRAVLLFQLTTFLLFSMRGTHAAPPSHVNGDYTWECSDATLTLKLGLSGGNNNQDGGAAVTVVVPIYCGPPNPTTPTEQVTRWNDYQQRLDMAEDDFEAGCNQLVTNLGIFAPPDADCTEAAANWRVGLEEINNNVAGLAPGHLVMEVNPGGSGNEFFSTWGTWSTLTLQDGQVLPLKYLIHRNGKIWSIGVTGGVNMVTQAAGCVGALGVISVGYLYGASSTPVSTLTNDYGGVLACGVAGGGLWIVVAASATVHAETSVIQFEGLPALPTNPPSPTITPCDPNPCQNGGNCVDEGNDQYTCVCTEGWTGDCDADIDECILTSPCGLGMCINTPGSYTCDCAGSGFTGADCQEVVKTNPCEPNPCQNGGNCVNDGNDQYSSYTCDCAGSGFTGADCKDVVETNPCDPNPCGSRECQDKGGGTYDCKRCFSGNNFVEVQGKGRILMSSLQIGDNVRVRGGEYGLVYSFGHLSGKAKTNFLQIHTGNHPPLEISAEHLLYVGDKATTKSPKIVTAAKVKVGDYLLSESGSYRQVTSIDEVQRHGYFAPHTTTGDIVVSGVLASSYAAIKWWAIPLPDPVLHWLKHGVAVPYGLYCKLIGGCKVEKYDPLTGLSPYHMILFRFYQWQQGLPPIVGAAFLFILVAPVLVCATLLGMLLSSGSASFGQIHPAVALLGGLLVWKSYMLSNKHLQGETEEGGLSKPSITET